MSATKEALCAVCDEPRDRCRARMTQQQFEDRKYEKVEMFRSSDGSPVIRPSGEPLTMLAQKTKVYLAGPMRGLPNFNYDAFTDAAAELRILGLEVFNPAEAFGGDQSRPAEDYLKLDLDWIVNHADEVMVLPDWQGSAGVRAEITVARALGIPIIDFETRQDIELSDLPVDMEAAALVYGGRQQDYGHPRTDFTRTGKMWAAILGVEEVTAEQVGLMMMALKISRQVNKSKRDNITDAIGYAITVARVTDMQA